jgi:predicted MFS family arabinose efflux permease
VDVTVTMERAERLRHDDAGMRRVRLGLFAAGLATFALLYTPQPLLPQLSRAFHAGPAAASLAMSAGTAALALAIIPVSSLSEVLGRRAVMITSVLAAAVLGLLAPLAPSLPALVTVRVLEGFALAGVAALALGCAVAFAAVLPQQRFFTPAKPRLRVLSRTLAGNLADTGLLRLYLIGFALMGAFVTVYNYLTFRLSEPPFGLSASVIGALFAVYLAGTWSSTVAGRLADRAGRRVVLPAGVALTIGGVALTLPASLAWVVAGLVLTTAGFFAAHSVASGWVGGRARVAPAQASALYLCLYYIGSSVAGSAGGVFYSRGGWPLVAAFAIALLAVALASALSLRTLPGRQDREADLAGRRGEPLVIGDERGKAAAQRRRRRQVDGVQGVQEGLLDGGGLGEHPGAHRDEVEPVPETLDVTQLGAQPRLVGEPSAVIVVDPAYHPGQLGPRQFGGEPAGGRPGVDERAERPALGVRPDQLEQRAGVEVDQSRSSSRSAISASDSDTPSSRAGSGVQPASPAGFFAGMISPRSSSSANARSAGDTGMIRAITCPRRVISPISSASASSSMTLAACCCSCLIVTLRAGPDAAELSRSTVMCVILSG